MTFDDDDTFTTKVIPNLRWLSKATEVLMISIAKAMPASNEVGSLEAVEGEIKVTCLGHQLKCSVRPVVNSHFIPTALELAFLAERREKPLLIRKYYVRLGDASVHRTLTDHNDHVCILDNPLLREHLLQDVAEGLLQSPVFAPTPDASAKV